jgi:hypothetical protein
MKFRLKYKPIPPNMHAFAEDVVAGAREINKVELDYSVASLHAVERILGSMHSNGIKLDKVADTVFSFGAYVGEVFCRHAGGRWVIDPRMDAEIPVVRLDKGGLCHTVGVCLKRVQNGPSESIVQFWKSSIAAVAE